MSGVKLDTYIEKDLSRENSQLNQAENISYVGAIDIGTNSTHLLIAAVDTVLKTFSIELAEKSTTRLGEKDPLTGELTNVSIQRTLETLKRFKDLADSYKVESLLTAATSAVREARNSEKFLSLIKDHIGLEVEVISGSEEARLIYLGVLSGMEFGEKSHVLIDIGGGSTELILADAHDSKALTSTKIGAVRLKNEFITREPISAGKSKFLRTFIQGSLEPSVDKILRRLRPGENPVMVATSGTAMAIGSLILSENTSLKSKLQGYKVSKSQIDDLAKKLLTMTLEELRGLTALSDRRSEIIVPGILILQTTMEMLDVHEVVLSERALREGLVVDWMFRNKFLQNRFSLQGSIRDRTVLHQAKRFRVNFLRSERVAQNALILYDNTFGVLHRDNGQGRQLLWAASMLHTCGQHINLGSYHKHSWYLIRHGELLGYSQSEHLMVAAIARYHRKSFPKKRHDSWQCLTEKEHRQLVMHMSILLRFAAALDQRPDPLVRSIDVRRDSRDLIIKLTSENPAQNLELEKWSLKKALLMSKEHINVKVKVEI